VRTSIKTGFRHIDCAAVYGNEVEIGKAFQDAFKDGDVKREDLWVTSKLWNSSHLKEHVRPALEKTLADLKLDYLDLYLMHWPIANKPGISLAKTPSEFLTKKEAPITETWKAMESCVEAGLTRHIGMSNFNITKLKEIQGVASIKPEMNQVELHPFLPQNKLVDYCQSNEIHLTAYSPFGSPDRNQKKDTDPSLFENEVVAAIAEAHDVTSAQVLIAFSINRGIAVIPKSVNASRLRQNFKASAVELTDTDMASLATVSGYRYIDGTFFTFEGSPYSLSDLWEDA
jgi:alcohol dehydrogenase (NADP+)